MIKERPGKKYSLQNSSYVPVVQPMVKLIRIKEMARLQATSNVDIRGASKDSESAGDGADIVAKQQSCVSQIYYH